MHVSEMAEKKDLKNEQNASQHLKKNDEAQQQQEHLNIAAEYFTSNHSIQVGYVPEDDRKIYIGGLKEEITEKDLSEHFGQFGEIKYIDFKVDSASGRSRGYAFVVFKKIEGIDHALACNNHVINDMKIEPKKAIPQRIKLFVGGLSSNITNDDIIDYFKRYTHRATADMSFDKIRNKRRGFCFITIENLEAVTEILRLPRHVIKEKQVDVKIAECRLKDYEMMPGASGSMKRLKGNVMGQGGFLIQPGYALYPPGYHYGGYGYYFSYTGYYPHIPNHHYSHPSYVAGVKVGYWSEFYEASAPSDVNGNQIV